MLQPVGPAPGAGRYRVAAIPAIRPWPLGPIARSCVRYRWYGKRECRVWLGESPELADEEQDAGDETDHDGQRVHVGETGDVDDREDREPS